MIGADLRLVPAKPFKDPGNYVHVSRRLAEELGAVWANQFDNLANREGHRLTTGAEIWEETGGKVDAFTCACGTGGMLDAVLQEEGIERIPGAHCYEFFATGPVFAQLAEAEPGTFYLTDFLLRHFDRLVLRGLGIDRHPELFTTYFGNYRKLVYLAQAPKPDSVDAARAIAERMGLAFEYRETGYGTLGTALASAVKRNAVRGSGARHEDARPEEEIVAWRR